MTISSKYRRSIWLASVSSEVAILLSFLSMISTLWIESNIHSTIAGTSVFGLLGFLLFFATHIILGFTGGRHELFAIFRGGVYLIVALLLFPALTPGAI